MPNTQTQIGGVKEDEVVSDVEKAYAAKAALDRAIGYAAMARPMIGRGLKSAFVDAAEQCVRALHEHAVLVSKAKPFVPRPPRVRKEKK